MLNWMTLPVSRPLASRLIERAYPLTDAARTTRAAHLQAAEAMVVSRSDPRGDTSQTAGPAGAAGAAAHQPASFVTRYCATCGGQAQGQPTVIRSHASCVMRQGKGTVHRGDAEDAEDAPRR